MTNETKTVDLSALNARDLEIVERLEDWFESKESFYAAVLEDSNSLLFDKLFDAIQEYADGEVSIYTSDRYEWIADHFAEVTQYEEEAISSGAKSIEDIAAYCWYETEREEARIAIDRLKKLLEA